MTGELSILAVGHGDTKLTFDPKKPDEAKRSAEIVDDMLKRGYVILIQIGEDEKGPIYRRAKGFDPEVAEYIVAGDPIIEDQSKERASVKRPAKKAQKGRKTAARRTSKTTRIPAERTKAVAIARTAGG